MSFNPPVQERGPALVWRKLELTDADSVLHLHRLATAFIENPSLVKPESAAYFRRILDGEGCIIGAFDGDLVAYGVLQFDHEPEDEIRGAYGIDSRIRTGRLAGASVAPRYRGNGLQRALIDARTQMAPQHMRLFSTAAPINPASWTNLLRKSFVIHDIVARFGGYTRYLMIHDTRTFDAHTAVVTDPLDIEQQRGLLARGYYGFSRAPIAESGYGIVFAKAAT